VLFRIAIIALLVFSSIGCFSQEDKTASKLKPNNIGVYYGFGNEQNLLIKDDDYLFKTQYIKASFYYKLNNRKYQLGLSIQPQIHFLKHQLLNKFFVQPFEDNFEENRLIFTKLKSMRLYALEFEISIKRKIFEKLDAHVFFGIGPAIIDTKTERLSKGFTFIENFGVGLTYQLSKKLFIDIKPSYNHISNAQIQPENSGYNVLNLEIGLTIGL